MIFIQEFAALVAGRVDSLTYLQSEDGGNVFVDKLPDGPHFEEQLTVCVSWMGGSTVYPLSLTENTVKVVIRGGERFNAVDAYTLAAEVRRELHGWLRARNGAHVGTIQKIEVAGPPQSIGYDEKNRSECMLICSVWTDDPVAEQGVVIYGN